MSTDLDQIVSDLKQQLGNIEGQINKLTSEIKSLDNKIERLEKAHSELSKKKGDANDLKRDTNKLVHDSYKWKGYHYHNFTICGDLLRDTYYYRYINSIDETMDAIRDEIRNLNSKKYEKVPILGDCQSAYYYVTNELQKVFN